MTTQQMIDEAKWDENRGAKINQHKSVYVEIRDSKTHFYRANPHGGWIQTGRANAETILQNEK
jgi:hypothetical protein